MATIVDFPVQHRIVTFGQPVFARPRRLAGDRLAAAKAEFKKLLDRGIIRPSSSQWASPLHLVPKPGNTWRITGDYRLLNARTRPDRHPLPIIEDLLQESIGKVFSVVDLYKAFYQIPVAEEDISKMAVTTPFGLFEFLGMPLGLRNSAQTFQRTMNYLLRDLDFVRCYQDDILVLSASHEQHQQHLRELLTILKRARLFVNWEKCQIGRSEVVFAGYLISEHGFKPPAAKFEAITRFPKPSDSTQLRRFIGMLNFYRRCLPHAAELMSPLTDLLRGLQKKKEKLSWSAQADEAFERIKQAMASAVRSAFYHPGQPLALHTDASNTAIGAALSQRHADDDWTPLGFFSQKLSPTQQRYSTYDRELLAIFEAIKYFQRILEGRSFTIMTDYRPLSFALEQKSDRFSPRQSRQLDFISRFDAKIVYTPGDENPVADALSRIDAITMPTTLNSAQISAEQQKDEQLPHLRGKARLKLHDVVIDGLSLVCVEHKNGLKPYLPESLRRQAFDTAHTLSHPSGRAIAKRVALLYFWPSMNKDIVRWAKQCVPCQQAKVHRHNRAELGNFVTPDGRFDHIHLDIVKMPLHQGFQNCLTMIDRYTRWPQAIPIADMSAPTVARAFYDGWISFFGTPLTITTDQGAQFNGKLLAELCKLVGAKHVHTSPYHPQSNSMVERLHRTLKAALKCSPETPWTLALPGVLLGLRTTFKEDLQASPAEMVFGTSLRIPGELMMQQDTDKTPPSDFVLALRRLFKAIRPVPASRHAQHHPFVFADLATCDYVFRRVDSIRKPLEQPYTGPHKVIRRINERTFVVDVNGVAKTLSTDQLKPAYLDNANPQPKPDQPTTTWSTQEQDDTQHSATQRLTSSVYNIHGGKNGSFPLPRIPSTVVHSPDNWTCCGPGCRTNSNNGASPVQGNQNGYSHPPAHRNSNTPGGFCQGHAGPLEVRARPSDAGPLAANRVREQHARRPRSTRSRSPSSTPSQTRPLTPTSTGLLRPPLRLPPPSGQSPLSRPRQHNLRRPAQSQPRRAAHRWAFPSP
ncbi:unnamed protein product [Trichogramma brassicae]|uniref:RNA-directed DNA polymerase n=1 Tax=Trichogramma brassicae TaxID=86971 RepID=A0A6H5I0Q3_9HYME|nr:unnamed protein product [Trichogramma brassicae]